MKTVELMTMAAEASQITPIIRPPKNEPEIIYCNIWTEVHWVFRRRNVSNEKQAREIVDAVKYHPVGSRSLAVGTTRRKLRF